MASIIKANINLNEIPKDKIYKGKKGSYLPITKIGRASCRERV